MSKVNPSKHAFWSFQEATAHIPLPSKFTFPFFYEPNELSILAVNQLKAYLKTNPFPITFGLNHQDNQDIGKMFGVLVVRKNDQLGFLCAFSGKIGDKSHYPKFVPPVFDVHDLDGFYKKGEAKLNVYNAKIESASKDLKYLELKAALVNLCAKNERKIAQLKEEFRSAKAKRAIQRKNIKDANELKLLDQESANQSILLKKTKQRFNQEKSDLLAKINIHETAIAQLKKERKLLSAQLQTQIFEQYYFLNANKERRSLGTIFAETALRVPPAGAGECAAPKLLHFAYENDYEPICMAEFWWGKPPQSEVRIHENFYPACKGKCEPILGFMLQGLEVDANPFLTLTSSPQIKIHYEDEDLIIVEKPHELLSVPGNTGADSVAWQLKLKYPNLPDLQLVHRLDMSTSGLMIAAKNQRVFKFIQRQFIQKTLEKRYVARLAGLLSHRNGEINLPLRPDYIDRPRQFVCNETGKPALTYYETIAEINGETIVYFYPKTGRTHQLRVHAAHQLGLNTPIKGDDIYGNRDARLFLHAESIQFTHPRTKELVSFHFPAPKDFFE